VGIGQERMIVEYIRYEIEPSQAEEFLGAHATASNSLERSSHCLGYELSQMTLRWPR
jgi:quinol monooxygenase YgiN